MEFNDYYLLGHVVKPFGLAGEVVIFLDVTDPRQYSKLDAIFIPENGQLIPHFITKIRINREMATVALEGFASVDEAATLRGQNVYLPLSKLPKLSPGEYYLHDLIGLDIYTSGNLLGNVKTIYEGAQNLIVTEVDGFEVLIPITDQIVTSVDLKDHKIMVDLPDGLIDIYREDAN
ncbi:MAG: ribosome maturation factor RimM [Cyclobacteriaceae bacterium]